MLARARGGRIRLRPGLVAAAEQQLRAPPLQERVAEQERHRQRFDHAPRHLEALHSRTDELANSLSGARGAPGIR